jgi:sugar phosphate isomerase/epimerase
MKLMRLDPPAVVGKATPPPGASRRDFLKRAAAAAMFAGGGASLLAPGAWARDPIPRKGKPRLLVSAAAYSFRDALNHTDPSKRITLFDFVDYCADRGCAGVELTSYYFPQDCGTDYLVELKRHVFLRGLAVSGTSVGNNFARSDGPELDRELAQVKLWIDRAAVLGAPHIRVFAGQAAGIDRAAAKRQCVRALETCAAYAAAKGIWLGLENHGGIVSDVADLLDLVRQVQNPWLGVNLDLGNFYGESDPYEDMARLAPYAVNVHFKAEVNRRGKGKEPVDIPRIVKVLREANYQGYVALEYESAPDPWTAVPLWLQRMQEAFGVSPHY